MVVRPLPSQPSNFSVTRQAAHQALVVTLIGALIGSVSLSGSIIAWAKLDGVIKEPLRVRGQQAQHAGLLATIAVGGYLAFAILAGGDSMLPIPGLIGIFFGCALLFGILMTLPIGGADMPVVISIYNALTGLAVGLQGFAAPKPGREGGMVVGAAGMLLTLLMAKAMNCSVSNVIFTNFGWGGPSTSRETSRAVSNPVEGADAVDLPCVAEAAEGDCGAGTHPRVGAGAAETL